MATLAVLFEQSYRAVQNDVDVAGFFHAGVFSAGCFAVAVSARLLARRVIANEVLAKQRGVDLNNQTVISQRVIEEMQDGVLVLSRDGRIRQSNPRARLLLGLNGGGKSSLLECSPELAKGFANWCHDFSETALLVEVPASSMQLQTRFVPTASTQNDVLVFLEDIGRLQERAQQMKLAALGRLTANIAHEIRNPLSAISHAGELLREERLGQVHQRLLRIVLDNVQRLERIVSDVLELGRRDRSDRELIDLREVLPACVDECLVREDLLASVVSLEISGLATLFFDRSHFHQVLFNLLGNALRHSRRLAGSVHLLVCDAPADGQVELHVIDDGEGVDDAAREQIFEPFFTTRHHGTGLGLYIARELCDANGAQLDLRGAGPGANFCLRGRAVGC
jgi:two-component system sensor histidine kinase PilS (NtrC family)